jgi:nicotinate-nucleotide adenylyltransferase
VSRGQDRIGIFGGSFDPPHHGHIHLVVSLMEAHDLDQVLIIPARANPLKETVASAEQRLQMARLAFDGIPRCTVLPTPLIPCAT